MKNKRRILSKERKLCHTSNKNKTKKMKIITIIMIQDINIIKIGKNIINLGLSRRSKTISLKVQEEFLKRMVKANG